MLTIARSAQVSGKQRLVTFDDLSIPINIRCGLPYIDMPPHTDQEWEELPHVLLTEDANWDPTHMDCKQGDDPPWYEQQDDPPLLLELRFLPLWGLPSPYCIQVQSYS
jgi:hypothetical protein